jgi:hypothetical protein
MNLPFHADLILAHGTVLTVDSNDSEAEAVAVKDGRILAVGSDNEVFAWRGPETEILVCSGRTVVPGFNDSHTHMASMGEFYLNPKALNCASELNPTIPDLMRSLAEQVEKTPKGEWVGGRNLDPNTLTEGRWPTRWELDEVSPDHPVVIFLRGFHAHVANSRALELAKVDRDTPDPEGGVIDRDAATGEPTGVMRDAPFIKAVLPPTNLTSLKRALGEVSELYAELGITSSADAGAPSTPDSYRAFQECIDEGTLQIRTYLMIREAFLRKHDIGLRTGHGNDRLRMGAMKIFVDGSIQAFTCAFHEPYIGKSTRGLEGLNYSADQLNDLVAEAHRLGFQVAMHAQGDHGIELAIDAVENAMNRYPRENPRHRIEHVLCPTETDLRRIRDLGIVPSFYVFHPWFWGDQHMDNFIGPERAARMVPVRTALELGIPACAHSDAPVCTPNDPVWPSNPLWGMACAVTRRTRGGRDIGIDERITPAQALRIYTINGAYASFEEDIKGSLEPGKLADMVVLETNPLHVEDPWEIRNIRVERTLLGGETTYAAS